MYDYNNAEAAAISKNILPTYTTFPCARSHIKTKLCLNIMMSVKPLLLTVSEFPWTSGTCLVAVVSC